MWQIVKRCNDMLQGSVPMPEFMSYEEAVAYFDVYIELLYRGVSHKTASAAADESLEHSRKEASCLKPH